MDESAWKRICSALLKVNRRLRKDSVVAVSGCTVPSGTAAANRRGGEESVHAIHRQTLSTTMMSTDHALPLANAPYLAGCIP